MISEPRRAFVWGWPDEQPDPVVVGVLDQREDRTVFTYGASYRRADGPAVYLPELPVRQGPILPRGDLTIAGCISDAGPDAWGQRVIVNRLVGRAVAADTDPGDISPVTYLLESGSDRIGALDFQESATTYEPRGADVATLDQLARAAQFVEQGVPLPPDLDAALLHGSSVGGARPKALLRTGDRTCIAKFSSSTDTYAVVKAEYVAMALARRAGLEAAPVTITSALGNDVLLVERFDRTVGGGRRSVVSALTILELDAFTGARYASYADLADEVLIRFTEPLETLRELFSRITFNVLVGNTDDHARNHSAFWNWRDETLTLTPAYDICPQPRAGGEATQAMAIDRDGRRFSQIAGCIAAAGAYQLSAGEAREIVDRQVDAIEDGWAEVCDEAQLSEVDRRHLWHRQFLNPYAFYDA
jgi:serine/threonine-protein kinase HipA